MRADVPVFVPDSPSAATAESTETQLQQTTQNKVTVWNEGPPAQPSLSEDRPEEARKNVNMPEVRVKLLKDTKVPAWHAKVVRVKVVNPEQVKKRISVNMLIPRNSNLLEERIVITNSLVKLDQEGYFKIMMENHSLNSVYLKQEQIVGALESVTQIPVEEISEVQDL